MKKRFCYFAGLLFLVLPVAQARIYKWLDDNGQVHYSEQAPDRTRAAKEIQLPRHKPQANMPSPEQRRQKRDNLLRAFDEERQLRKDVEAKKNQQAARRQHNCILARDKLKNYQRATVLYDLDATGKRIYLSDSQRSRAEAGLKSQISKWCH
ncbi:hypothetical protein MNBD_GAMMA24-2826 [hydrothermal vent metagenome]|uniref:DUF4124 domain-containing protein n=1 Tax=hydrothermal vent metagenome TaxID=652676 RepID=A0A3B1C5I9_9ZZZZ